MSLEWHSQRHLSRTDLSYAKDVDLVIGATAALSAEGLVIEATAALPAKVRQNVRMVALCNN